jgi:hypothetical protein
MITFSILTGIIPAISVVRNESWYIRYFIPFFPLAAVLITNGFAKLKNRNFKAIFISSLVLFSIFSFALTSTSALFYQGVEKENAPLFNYINSNSEINDIASFNKARDLTYYTRFGEKKIIELNLQEGFSLDELKNQIFEKNPSYIISTCYNDPLSEKLPLLEEEGLVEKIFDGGCSAAYRVL